MSGALSYECKRPYATNVCGLTLLEYAALRSVCLLKAKELDLRLNATSVWDLMLLVYAVLRYYCLRSEATSA